MLVLRRSGAAESASRVYPGRVRNAVHAAGLGPEPPFTHTPRLPEHGAAAQVNTGTFEMNWVPANDNASHLHRRRPPPSRPISVGHPRQGRQFIHRVDPHHPRDGADAPPLRLLLGQADRRSVDLDRLGGGFHPDRRQLVAAGQRRCARGFHDPDRVPRSRRCTPSDVQIRPVERLGQPDHREPTGRDQLRLVAEQAQPAPREPEQGGSRPRHRIDGSRPHSRTGNQATQPS